jgi:CO/xanthine dehydrogenase Mo-binding subunit
VAQPTTSTLGTNVSRLEGPERVTGQARFTADIDLPNALWAKSVFSPVAHARIRAIDTSAALAIPGVRAVVTAMDLPNAEKRLGRSRYRDLPILAQDRVRYIGDRVAVVAADTLEAAEAGALAVQVDYEELAPVFDPFAAMEPNAPVLHPDADTYPGRPQNIPKGVPNLAGYGELMAGDIEAGMAEADVVLEHTFTTQLSHQGYLEPNAFALTIHEDGRVGVWASNKAPFSLRRELAEALDLPESEIVVHRASIGADFGGKGGQPEPIALYFLAKATGRPVKQVMTYGEDLSATAPRHPATITIKTGVKRDGTIVARDARVVFNSGAFAAFKPSPDAMLPGGVRDVVGCYDIPNVRVRAYMVYTNQVPGGYMRAPGQSQAFFAVETHTDLLARELGMDPVEFRRKNVTHRQNDGGEAMAPPVLEAAAAALGSGGMPTPGTRRGRGIALGSRGSGTGEGSSDVTVNPDGTISVVTGLPDNGPGGLTVVAQTAAEVFGVPLDRINLVLGDTDSLPVDAGSGASRITVVATSNVRAASEKVIEQLTPYATQMLAGGEARWTGGGWSDAAGERFVPLEDFAREMVRPGDPNAHAQVTVSVPRAGGLGYCCQAAEVEVDPETGQVRILRLISAQDTGTIVNALSHQAQIDGAVVQGVGYALTEELSVADGRVQEAGLGDYKLPTMPDIPRLETVNLPSTGIGDWNIRSIGEIVIAPTAGAIANAVADAIGAPIRQLPITPERVLAALDEKRRGSPDPSR